MWASDLSSGCCFTLLSDVPAVWGVVTASMYDGESSDEELVDERESTVALFDTAVSWWADLNSV